MNTELRERAIYPILIPLAAIVVTEIVVFSMSRVLLVSGKNEAVVIALGTALAILIGATMIAARPRLKTTAILGFLALLLVGTIAVGGYAAMQKPFYEREAEANRPTVPMTASNLSFSEKELHLATSGTVITFENGDSQPHNIAIYGGEDATAPSLFKGDIVPAGASANYEVPAIEAGEYYFQCDVHPNMNGKATAEAAAEGDAGDEGAEH